MNKQKIETELKEFNDLKRKYHWHWIDPNSADGKRAAELRESLLNMIAGAI